MKKNRDYLKKMRIPLLILMCASLCSCHREKGYEYVDLGLSVKWATCNVGASSPEDCGDYFIWGDVETELLYCEANCDTYGILMDDIAGNPQYDAARAKCGGKWRMPTELEFQELIYNCSKKWIERKGVWGLLLTSKKNGKSIFLPANSYADLLKPDLSRDLKTVQYWSSTPGGAEMAVLLYAYKISIYTYADGRAGGRGIRPVFQ